jgi:hypothetical protein
MTIDLNKHYCVSKEIIAKEIEEELVIVPLKAGVGDLDSEIYSLNSTGISIWEKLTGTRSLDEVIKMVSVEYGMPYDEIKLDVIQLLEDLVEKGIVVAP